MTSEEILQAKKRLRQEALKRRGSFSEQTNRVFSEAIEARLMSLDVCREAGTVFAFAAMSDEVQLYSFMEKALAEGKRVAVPLIVGKGVMEAVRVRFPTSCRERLTSRPCVKSGARSSLQRALTACLCLARHFRATGRGSALARASMIDFWSRRRRRRSESPWHFLVRSWTRFPERRMTS